MLCKTPKSLNAVDMVFAAISERFAVIQTMVLAPSFQGVIAAKRIGVINRSFAGMFSDMGHKLIRRHPFHDLCIHPPIALQKPKYNAFTGSPSSAPALASAAKICLVNLYFSLELAGFQFSHVVDCFAQTLVDTRNRLIVNAQIACHAICRLLLIEAGEYRNLAAKSFQRFLALAFGAFHVPAPGLVYLKRTAENTLSAPQKVGRTVENVVSSSNHKGILSLDGYESN